MMYLFLVGQLLDLTTFLICASLFGIQYELNPLMRFTYLTFGPIGPMAMKAIGSTIVIAMLSFISHHKIKSVSYALIIFIGFFGAFVNTLFFIQVVGF